jgi:ABC-type uncharacterized transport system auxiliary subunit
MKKTSRRLAAALAAALLLATTLTGCLPERSQSWTCYLGLQTEGCPSVNLD